MHWSMPESYTSIRDSFLFPEIQTIVQVQARYIELHYGEIFQLKHSFQDQSKVGGQWQYIRDIQWGNSLSFGSRTRRWLPNCCFSISRNYIWDTRVERVRRNCDDHLWDSPLPICSSSILSPSIRTAFKLGLGLKLALSRWQGQNWTSRTAWSTLKLPI